MSTAVETLKRYGRDFSTIQNHFSHFMLDKGYGEIAERLFALPEGKILLPQLVGQFLLLLPPHEAASIKMRQSIAAGLCGEGQPTYYGTAKENEAILQSFFGRGEDEPFFDEAHQVARLGKGVAAQFSLRGFRLGTTGLGAKIARTPITFIGAGPATILLARTLVDMGFRHVTIFDPSGAYGGIWLHKNVRQGSRNNPLPIIYDTFRAEAAPGPGEGITHFLSTLATPPRSSGRKALPSVYRNRVVRVEPGDLTHRVVWSVDGKERHLETPLLIAALGQGKPLAPSRAGVMTTDTPARAGIRWQQPISVAQAQKLHGKTVVLIGLGNSTAEMLLQLQRYRDAGLDIRIKVLSHYSSAAVHSPFSTDRASGKQLYREPGAGQLTNLAGDLAPIREAFERLQRSRVPDAEELIPEVEHWHLEQEPFPNLMVTLQDGRQRQFPCDQLYTLIGYAHPVDMLQDLGMRVLDPTLGTIAVDYDGEIQCAPINPGRGRIFPGYFAAGALLRGPYSDSAQVIPGMLYRLPDQIFSICLRAAEYALLSAQQKKTPIGNSEEKTRGNA